MFRCHDYDSYNLSLTKRICIERAMNFLPCLSLITCVSSYLRRRLPFPFPYRFALSSATLLLTFMFMPTKFLRFDFPKFLVKLLSIRDATTAAPSGAMYSGGMPRISYVHCISSVCMTNFPTCVFPYSVGVNDTMKTVPSPARKGKGANK